jgi:hypothetical protein
MDEFVRLNTRRGRNELSFRQSFRQSVLGDRHVVVDALTRGMQSSFKEVLAGPIPEAWLASS